MLCLLDYARWALSSRVLDLTWLDHLAHVTLLFVSGYLVGLLVSPAFSASMALAQWVALRSRRSLRQASSAAVATLALPVIVPVAIALFQGRSIRQTSAAHWGPWAITLLAWALVATAAGAFQHLQQSLAQRATFQRRAALVLGAGCLLAPLVYADLYLYYGLYGYLHVALMASSFVLIAATAYLLLGAWRRAAASIAGVLFLLCLPALAYSSARYAARPADFATHFAYTTRAVTLARRITDWDRDGYSNIFGHADPAVFDARVRPLAVDVPDDGTDQDGVFGDLRRAELERARRAAPSGRNAEARARYRSLSAPAPRHLLLITIDTLRADRVMPENAADPAPFSEFRRGSVRFERAFASSSYTQASVTMMMTSRYDARSAESSLFDVLHAGGCTTLLAFAQTPYVILSGSQPNVVSSFDERIVVPDREPDDRAMFHSYAATRPTSKPIVAAALKLLDGHRDERTCTWVYLFDVHQWRELRDPEVIGGPSFTGPDRYDRAVSYTLRQVSDLLSGLERLGLAGDTLVALSGDHGEGLGEKGIVGHTRWVHDPLLHVPLLIRAPNIAPRVVGDMEAGLIDLAPTLLDLLDVDDSLPHPDGASLLPAMLGGRFEHAIFAHEENYDAVMAQGFKLIVDRPEGHYRLHDLANDPQEERSLFDSPSYEQVARALYLDYQAGPIGPFRPHAQP